MSNENGTTQQCRGTPWFWNVLGGAIISVVILLLLTILNNLHSRIDAIQCDTKEIPSLKEKMKAQDEVNKQLWMKISEQQKDITILRERTAVLEQNLKKGATPQGPLKR